MTMVKLHTNTGKRTHNHDKIREWVESRGGTPSVVEHTWDGYHGALSVDFDSMDTELAEISWEEFFRIFEQDGLDFVYQDESESRYCRFVPR